MQEERENEGIQINLGEIFRYMLHKWWIVAVSVVVCLAVGFVIGKVQKKTVYKSEINYVVSYVGGNSTSEINTGLNLTYNIIGNCTALLKENRFLNQSLEHLKGEMGEESLESYDLDVKKLKKYITPSCSSSTDKITMMYVSIQTEDAELSYKIAQSLAGEYQDAEGKTTSFISEYIKSTYVLADGSLEFSLINDIEKAEKPESDSSVLKWTAIFGVVGLLGCAVVMGAVVVLDTRVKSVDDLTEKYGAAILGTIPDVFDKGLYKSKKYGKSGSYGYGYREKGENK